MQLVEPVTTRMHWIDVSPAPLLDRRRATATVRERERIRSRSTYFYLRLDRPYSSNGRHREEFDDHHSPASKASFQAHVNALDRRYDQTSNGQKRGERCNGIPTFFSSICSTFLDDDVLSLQSARSLSSTCSLASQTYELAHRNLQKFWGDKRKENV